jgi:hypothetical protein
VSPIKRPHPIWQLRENDTTKCTATTNDKFPCYAPKVLQFSWAVYSFQGGQCASTIQSWNLPFHISLACDQYKSGCSLFQEFTSCCQIFSSSTNMLNHNHASGNTSVIHGYLIQSPHFQTSDTTTKFWQLQATIIAQLCLIGSLQPLLLLYIQIMTVIV